MFNSGTSRRELLRLTTVAGAMLTFPRMAAFAQPQLPIGAQPHLPIGTIHGLKSFCLSELEKNWSTFSADADFRTLLHAVEEKGFDRLADNERTAWGFSGEYEDGAGKKVQTVVCGYDFYKTTPTGIQMCSMVWRKVGDDIYKCYMVFPIGEKNAKKAFTNSVEYTVDKDGNLQLAHSFGKCFARCVFRQSLGFCAQVLGLCGIVTTGVGLASGGTITLPIALAIFATCGGVCLGTLALCAVQCN